MSSSMDDGHNDNNHHHLDVEVPPHFLCPISLQLMRDPVITTTGVTYDRDSIERWLFSFNNTTCPVTKQPLSLDSNLTSIPTLTPNHTLRRLIQSWCTLNAIDRIPTPKPRLDNVQLAKLLNDAKKSPRMHLTCLRHLRSRTLVEQNWAVRYNCLDPALSGAIVNFLALVIRNEESTALTEAVNEDNDGAEMKSACDVALDILHHLKVPESDLKKLLLRIDSNNGVVDFLESLLRVMRSGSYPSRAQATAILRSVYAVADPLQLMNVRSELFRELVKVLEDRISPQASKSALKLMVELCPWGRNRIKAIEGGAVTALIELLLDHSSSSEKRACELILMALDQLCGCAEGRAELVRHGAGLAVVSKRILRVSHVVTDRGVRILGSIARFSVSSRVLQEMLQVGVVAKLCLVLQVEGGAKTKERARDVLRLHSRVWRTSNCVPPHLLSSYPS